MAGRSTPRVNDRYEVRERLGSGSEGQVYLVADRHAGGALRALKLVTGAEPRERQRLAGEFRRLARLDHPCLVAVHDLGELAAPALDAPAGTLFFTSDHVTGQPLRDLPGPDPVAALIAIAEDLASALAHLHAHGLVHCDVKPDNALVDGTGPDARAVLVDLGLASAPGATGARGSLPFMSPEALAGHPDERSDLYGLGATLYRAVAGRPPFDGDGAELAAAIARGRAAPLCERAPWLPAELGQLCDRLLAADPARRPSSAAVVLGELARIREGLDLPPGRHRDAPALPVRIPPRLIGRDAEVAAVARALRALAAGAPAPALLELCGPDGSGRGVIAEHALRQVQLAAAAGSARAPELLRGGVDELAAALGVAAPDAGEAAELAAALAARARLGAVVVLLDEAGDPRGRLLARAAAELAAPDLLVVRVGEVAAVAGSVRVEVAPLSLGEVGALAEAMLGRPVTEAFAGELARVSSGLPRIAVEIVREVAARGDDDGALRPAALVGDDLDRLLVKRVARLPRAEAAALEALAVLGGAGTVDEVAAVLEIDPDEAYAAIADAGAGGFASLRGDRAELPSPAHQRALSRALPAARSRALHRAALRHFDRRGETDPVVLARHSVVAGPARRAASECAAAAVALTGRGLGDAALAMARAAAEHATGAAEAAAAALWAECAEAVGAYDEAAEAAARAMRSRQPESRRRGLLAAARAAHKRGAIDDAEELLARLVEAFPGDAAALGARARFLVGRGRYREALEVAAGCADRPVAERGLAVESTGLAHFYLGDHAAARAELEALEAATTAAGDHRGRGRALALLGMLAQAAGDVATAAERYRRAAAAARRAGDLHGAAVCELNRATAESHRGRFGEALAALTDAAPELERLGSTAERAAALFNRGNALLAVGELDAAERAAERARAAAEDCGDPTMSVYARLLAGDVARRRGRPGAAAALYSDARDRADAARLADAALAARTNLAEATAELGDPAAVALAAELQADGGDAGARLALARGRVALAVGGDTGAPAAALESLAPELAADQSFDLSWRAAAVAARLRRAGGDRDRAAELCRRARRELDVLVHAAPEPLRAGLGRDPDAQALAALEADLAISEPARGAVPGRDADLRRLLALGRRLNSELRLEPLLDDVIDTAIELAAAERGFLLLAGADGELEVVVARGIDRERLDDPEVALSRSIAERAARTGETIVTVDAEIDDRFGGAASVAAMRLRSVLAVPLRQKSRLVGTLYLDHRFRRGAFDDDAALLLRELADIAAVAIENARLTEDGRRRRDEIAELNRRLSGDLDRAEVELAEVRGKLPEVDRERGTRRFGIVGRAPAMLDLFASLERAAAAELPVVITGESGTGKELVARAVHQGGPRAERAFVAVNCGAVPDQLLESELFGHVRGAFTGADRERRGLFEVADGGTLFLDEIADTSPAMQTKLLRVLQEGEIRRLGDERTRQVDVRVVAASNRDLGELTSSGTFREDLFYRLSVLELRVPPLRARLEDLGDLAEHILARLARDGAPRKLSRAALGRLAAHDWPGNVRELENELARAAALADGVIGVDDLSPHIARAVAAPPSPASGDLRLKPRVEALERSLVDEAMSRTGGNQSRAAELLGLSRYGLQKKLKRYGVSDS